MQRFGFNYITDEAKVALEKEGVRFEAKSSSMIDVEAQENYRTRKIAGEKYIYMFNETVYICRPKNTKDYSTNPPTIIQVTILDIVDKDDQSHMRDLLMMRAYNQDSANGGVLI